MPTSSRNAYSRFIPKEEVGLVTQWQFGAVDGSDAVEPEPEAEPDAPLLMDEAAQQELVQKTWDEAFAQGVIQGRDEATAEWQRRMDEYVANQGRDAAQRVSAILHNLDGTLADMQQRMAEEVLHLACDIARHVVRQELSGNPNAMQAVVREALGLLVQEGRPATVRINPADMEAMEQPLRGEFAAPGVQWVADAAVPLGGCLVESAGTVVDGTLEKRWQRAIAPLGLQVPWDGGGDHG